MKGLVNCSIKLFNSDSLISSLGGIYIDHSVIVLWKVTEPSGETNLPWQRQGYNTGILVPSVRFRVTAKFWVLLLNNLTVVKIPSLNTIDPCFLAHIR